MLTLYLLLWVHFVACLWFAVVKMEKEWVPVPDWMTGETEFWSEDVWTQYFTCFYTSIWLLVGGEVGARNTLEAAVGAVFMVLGALLNAILFGEISVLISNLNAKRAWFQNVMSSAMTTMHNIRVEPKLMHEILDFITDTQGSLSYQEEFE